MTDFMPVTGTLATTRHRIVRMVRCVRGEMTFAIDIAPRFDYGREPHQTHLTEAGAVFEGDQTAITVSLIMEPDEERLTDTQVDAHGDIYAETTLRAGQMRGLVLETGRPGRCARCGRLRRGGSSTRRSTSGRPGWASRRTPAAGASS